MKTKLSQVVQDIVKLTFITSIETVKINFMSLINLVIK